MKETWRWFGPQDAISLAQVRQTGATGVVTALHHLYQGEVWPLEEVMKRKAEIEAHGLVWSVAESIPVHKSIKLRSGPYKRYIEWWQKTLRALGKAGIRIVCYNFMPGVDWTRTDLKWRLPSGALALRFDAVDFATYDLFVLKRTSAEGDYRDEDVARAYARFKGMSEDRQKELEQTIIAGLPASEVAYDRDAFTLSLEEYKTISANDLRSNLTAFLQEVVPVAEENGIRIAIHPDDPPWPLFGLPRIVSTASDVRAILKGCDSPSNGLTFCVGSFGARPDNDLLAMVDEFAPRINFAHLRQVMREKDGSFYEADHLHGSSDMVGVIQALMSEERRRFLQDVQMDEIPMRPDHGHLLLAECDKTQSPGYSLIGRLKGLAELRGVMEGLKHVDPHLH